MNARINITYRNKDGDIIVNPYEGELAHSPETGKLYIYTNSDWKEVEGGAGVKLSLYDMNKQLIAQQKPLTKEQVNEAMEKIIDFMTKKANTFYMLLCRDINYYTMFHCVEQVASYDEVPTAAVEVIACANCVGKIKSIEIADEHAIEIWVHNEEADEEPLAMYLFPYDEGVITCAL